MNNSIKIYNQRLAFGRSKLLGSAVLLAATSSLFACSETENSVANSAQAEVATTQSAQVDSAQLESPQTDAMPVMLATANKSGLLNNVSATVYKDAYCGCCKEWIGHAEDHGLEVTANDVTDLVLFKNRYGVPNNMQSCHTTVTSDGYVFEGHVPAKHMAQFLANPPNGAIGLAVPGMPVGSPGMEYQDQFMPYQIMRINKDGSSSVYANIDSPAAQL